jgi:hypothetical protein
VARASEGAGPLRVWWKDGFDTTVLIQKAFSIGLVLLAAVWAAAVYRASDATDDGGPPIAALCVGSPAILLLLFAAAAWPTGTDPQINLRRYLRRAPGTFCTHCGRDVSGDPGLTCPACGTAKVGNQS